MLPLWSIILRYTTLAQIIFFVGGVGGQNLNVLEMLVYVILDSVSKMVTVRVTGADPGNLIGGLFHRCSHTHF